VDVAEVTAAYLLYVVVPVWLVAGFADWLCHRASSIETTTGPKESVIHLLMLAEMGAAILLALFFRINALVVLLMLALLVAHEITSYWDVRYATGRRRVTAFEQKVHDYLAVIPFMAFSFVVVLHWPQVAGLFDSAAPPPDFTLTFVGTNVPVPYVASLLGAVVLFELLPFAEELLRGLRAKARGERDDK